MVKYLLVALLVTSCVFDEKQFGDRQCNSDQDCGRPDLGCVGGLCAQKTCTAATDCGALNDFDCAGGLCVVHECTGLDDCALGYDCDGHFCQSACADHDGDGVGYGAACAGVPDCNDADPAI